MRRYKDVICWYLALKDLDTAKLWHEKMPHVVRCCVGEDSLMYRELQLQQEETGMGAVRWGNTAAAFADVSLDDYSRVEEET